MEELLLDYEDIEYQGYSSMILNTSYMHVKSFYGRIHKKIEEIKYNEEVEKIFAVDIDYLKEHRPKVYHTPSRWEFPDDFPFDKIPNGREYKFWTGFNDIYFYDTEPVIWGLTAKLLNNYIESLD